MKKVIIYLLTVVIALGGLGFAHAAVTDSQDDLLVYPTAEAGDPSVLESLTASMTFTCGDHLRWHTDHAFGGETATQFIYDRKGQERSDDWQENRFEMYLSGGFATSVSGGTFILRSTEYGALFQTVAADTAKGERKSMELNMADYVDYYQPDYYLHYQDAVRYCSQDVGLHNLVTGEDWYIFGQDSYRQLLSRFRFPVQSHTVSITIGKDITGGICNVELWQDDGPSLEFASDLNEEGIWFVPVFRDEQGAPLPYESPEGHGIYFAPWKSEGKIQMGLQEYDSVTPDLEAMELVISLEESVPILHLELDSEAKEAWVLTIEDGQYILTCRDLNTGSSAARIPLLPATDAMPYAHFVRDDGYLLVTAEDRIALVDTITRSLLLTAPDTGKTYAAINYEPESGCLRFDGEKLYLIAPTYYRDAAFWTAVWEQDAVSYYGEYDCSIMRGNDDWYYSYISLEEEPLVFR